MLLAPGDATGMPGGVHLSVSAPVVLTGHSLKLSANVTDTHYFPMELPVEFYASAGTVQDATFTAPDFAGTASITAAYDQWTAQRDVLVVDTPLRSLAEAESGVAATAVVEPPPSRHRAVTQPSSAMRLASGLLLLREREAGLPEQAPGGERRRHHADLRLPGRPHHRLLRGLRRSRR